MVGTSELGDGTRKKAVNAGVLVYDDGSVLIIRLF